MAKRRKIILMTVMLAIVYGAYSFFLESPLKRSTVDTGINKGELNKMIADVAENLSKEGLDKADAYIIARAEAEWKSDPFYKTVVRERRTARERKAVPVKLKKVPLTYSGYVEMGDKRVAVINGIEYETGEELEVAGYIIERIEPLEVVIGHKKNPGTFTVPVVEGFL